MEKDVDLIVEIESGEAELLLRLIELLFDEWYVAQHDRNERLAAVREVAKEKRATQQAAAKRKKDGGSAAAEDPT